MHSPIRRSPLLGFLLGSVFLASDPAPAQQPGPVVSPEVLPDRTVVFRLRAPNATNFTVSGQFQKGAVSMATNAPGVWSATVGPVAPGVYEYSFGVDGLGMIDPGNRAIKPMRAPRTSILEIPGDPPLDHDFQAVPHGSVHLHWYASKALGVRRALQVYTPPGYEKSRKRYPTLYLFHGSGDNEATWVAHGRAHWIFDNLFARGRAQPMVVVMLDGHAAAPRPPGTTPGTGDRNRNTTAFQSDLLGDALPLVESTYRVRRDPDHRAIIGLSMGGGQSLAIGLTHPDLFAWVGGMSSAVFEPETTLASVLADPKKTNARLKLLWFACGKDDFLLQRNQQFDKLLTDHGIRHEYLETPGDHSWPLWRPYLAAFAPRLFR